MRDSESELASDGFSPSASALAALAHASAFSSRIKVALLLSCFTFGPSLRLRGATMAAADFWRFFTALSTPVAHRHTARPLRVLTNYPQAYAFRIYIMALRASTGLCVYRPARPPCRLDPLAVRQASALPTASSRIRLATGTIAVQLTLPLAGVVEDLHPQVSAPCLAHRTETLPLCPQPHRE